MVALLLFVFGQRVRQPPTLNHCSRAGVFTNGGMRLLVFCSPFLALMPGLVLLGRAFTSWHHRILVACIALACARSGFRLAATCGTPPHKESDYSGQANAFQWFYLAVVCPCYITSLCAVASYSHPLSLCVALFAAIWFKVAVCMSLCLHRYAAHAAFQCEGATQLACGILGCLAFQGGPLWWAAKHRSHHKYCDVDSRDPHSPALIGDASAFTFFIAGDSDDACARMQAVDEDFVPAHADSRTMRWLDTFGGVLFPALEFLAAFQLGGDAALWVSFCSSALCQSGSLWFNVKNHPPHGAPECSATAQTPGLLGVLAGRGRGSEAITVVCDAVTALIAPLAGEGTHDHHHKYPRLAVRPGADLCRYVVAAASAAGLIHKVHWLGRVDDSSKAN